MPTIPKAVVTSDTRVKALHRVAIDAQEVFRSKLADLQILLNPAQALEAAKSLITIARSPEEIEQAQAQLFRLQGGAAELGRMRAISLAHVAKAEFKATLTPLVVAAMTAINTALAEAESAEEAFFRSHDLPAERTSLSKRFHAVASEIEQMMDSLADNSAGAQASVPSKSSLSNIIDWFADEQR